MYRLERVPENIRDILLGMMEAKQARMWTAIPCIIQSVNFAKKTCVAQPAVQLYADNPDGTRTWINLPPLLDVPMVFPSGGGFLLSFPVAKGDEALVIFSARCIDQWWQGGAYTASNGKTTPQKQAILRMHDLSDGFAIIGISSVPNVPVNISQNSVQLRTVDGTAFVEVKSDGNITISSWVGMIASFAMGAIPPGWLACPTAQTLVSTTTYPKLFAAIGYTWGGSGGSFGIPYFAAGYVPVAGTPGLLTHGALLAHTHTLPYAAYTGGYANTAGSGDIQGTGRATGSTGGPDNLAAGMGVQLCVKY